jgi:hypothetical protein
MSQFMVVEGGDTAFAGAVVFWSLQGYIDYDDLCDLLADTALPKDDYPGLPTLEAALFRAAEAAVRDSRPSNKDDRFLIRPVRRSTWEIVHEHVGTDLEYTPLVRVETTDDGVPVVRAKDPNNADAVALADLTLRKLPTFRHALATGDVSMWLLKVAEIAKAVSLRDRGGFYFIPLQQVELWRSVVTAVRSVSSHKLYEMPAVRNDDVVEAVLDAVRREAEQGLSACETYLTTDVSTRGLNAWERDLDKLRGKLADYAALLGQALPDFTAKVEYLSGLVVATRIKHKAAK